VQGLQPGALQVLRSGVSRDSLLAPVDDQLDDSDGRRDESLVIACDPLFLCLSEPRKARESGVDRQNRSVEVDELVVRDGVGKLSSFGADVLHFPELNRLVPEPSTHG